MALLRSAAEFAPRWYWDFCAIFGLVFSVVIAVVAGPVFAIFSAPAIPIAIILRRVRPRGTPPHKAFKLWMAWVILIGGAWVVYLLLALVGVVDP
jgi:hypothetical protein